MACAKCGRQNPAHARFCGGCGVALAPSCPSCGAECEPDARFCTSCGVPLAESAARPVRGAAGGSQAAARKVVTVVFADLIGSVALHERLDAESGRRETERYHRAMTVAVEAHGGRVVQLLGDGVLAVFGVPRVAEDDAIRAVRAAVGMQRAYREMVRAASDGGPLAGVGLRVAVNTGEMVVGDDETVIGDVTNVAARLQHEARDGDVIVGEGTQRLIGDLVTLAPLGAVALRGRAESVRAWRVVSLEPPASARATPFVGREAELGRLLAVWDDAVASRSVRLAVLLGSPGLGKSRLLGEVARHAGERATVLSARCDAAGGPTFAPIAEALRVLLRIEDDGAGETLRAAIDTLVPGDDAERARIVAGVSALFSGASSSPEETFFAVRRLLTALAAVRPVLLVVDDVHWAAPLLLDLVEHLVQWSGDVPLAILAAARPELRDVRSSLASAGAVVRDVVTLGGLDAASSMQLAAGVAGAAELPAALVGRVLATSEGNPLFLAELVRMLVQDGVLRREGERWVTTVEVAQLDMPPTIGVLLAARIERLRPEERAVLERAAVVGRRFSRAAVALLVGGDPAELDAHLEALRRTELIEPDTGWLLGEPALRFHHVLIRDAAYRRVLKETRAELHERLAGWIEERVGDAVEHEEMLGWHLEQAHQNLRELGPLDERGRALGERAARHLGAAGRRALARDDLALAASLLGRAIAALDAGHPMRAELALDWCEALLAAGDVEMAADAIAELERVAGESERLRAWHACFAGQLAALIDPQSLRATAEHVAAAAEVLAAAGDAQGEAKAHAVHAGALARLGAMGACEAALDKALAAARHARDRRRANSVLAGAPVAALWGPSPVTRASGRCLDVVRVLRITQGAPAVEAVALRCQAVLESLRGRGEAARRMVASSRRMVEELGLVQQLLEADVFAALIELLEGDAATAEAFLAKAYAGLREHGLALDAARAAALLGRAVLAQGRAGEAEALSHESESLAGDDLKAAIAWRGVRAEAIARRGEAAAAVELARAAVDLAAATDALLDHADARIALATALRAAGRAAEAETEEHHAAELWRQKGATLLLERAAVAAPETAAAVLPRTSAGRVRDNAATAEVRRLDAAVAVRDLDAVRALFASLVESVHHPLGVTLTGGDGAVDSVRRVLQHAELEYRHEPLATLGECLALSRQHVATSGVRTGEIDVGPVDAEHVWLSQVDAEGRRIYSECFAPSQLGHAVVRLYELYASLEPDDERRASAAATARALAVNLRGWTAADLERDAVDLEGVLAPAVSFHDHRTVGFGSLHGAQRYLGAFRRLRAASNDTFATVDAVLAARPDGVVLLRTSRGTDRASGGAFEIPLVDVWTFDDEGRLEHVEVFDAGRANEALARFDALVGSRPPLALPHRVRETAATAEIARLEAAVLAHDAAAIERVFEALEEVVHHPLGVTWDRDGARRSLAMLLQNPTLEFHHVVVATLGERLALSHQYASSGSVRRDDFDVGAVEAQQVALSEVDERGRRVRVEFFATERLGVGTARLYERHAALLPEGTEKQRAAAVARGVAAVLGVADDDGAGFRAVLAPDIRFADHQTLGLGAARGAGRLHRGNLILHEVARDMTSRVLEVYAVEPDALVARRVTRGTDRSHGGEFVKDVVELWAFDARGRLTHLEHFAPDDVERALRRLSLLRPAAVRGDAANVLEPCAPPMRGNSATAHVRRLDAAWAAAEVDALESVFAPKLEVVHHPTGATYGYAAAVQRFRDMVDSGHGTLELRHEPLATLGDALALCRARSASRGMVFGGIDAGALEIEYFVVVRADAAARSTRVEVFASDRLGDAVVRFYEMHAEDARAGEEGVRAVALARAVGAVVPMDVELIGAALAPDVAFADRRRLGLGAARGAERYMHGLRSLVELTRDSVQRTTDVLVATERALLLRRYTTGVDRTSDGTFELELLMLWAFGDDARITHIELFDVDDGGSARARADGLVRPEPLDGESAAAAHARPRHAGAVEAQPFVENAATRVETRMRAALASLDRDAIEQLVAPAFRAVDLRRDALVEADREAYLTSFWPMFESLTAVRQRVRHLATRGERMSLGHVHWWAEQTDGRGPVELEWLSVIEVDDAGRLVFDGEFDPRDLDAAHAELDARYAAGEGAAHPTVLSSMRTFAEAFARRDWDALAACCAPDLVVNDHRRLGWETLHGPGAYVAALRALIELAPDTRMRLDHVETAARGFLVRTTWVGTREGGRFEEPSLMVGEVDEAGRVVRFDQYEPDRLDAARARFAGIGADRASDALARWLAPNAATRARDRVEAAIRNRDWAAMRSSFAPGAILDDRRRLLRTTIAADQAVELMRETVERAPDFRSERRLLAVFGDRIAVEQQTWHGTPDGAPVEVEMLVVLEADAAGRLVAVVDFDPDDRRAAFREASARLAPLEPEHAVLHQLSAAFFDAAADHDGERMRALHADDVVVQSWRRTGIELLEGVDACMASIEALWELTTRTEVEVVAILAMEPSGSVTLTRLAGTLRDGGRFETLLCGVVLIDGDRFVRFEQLEPDDAERALERFAELSAQRAAHGPVRIPPNGASRTADRSLRLMQAGDWEGLRALYAPDAMFDDRRPLLRVAGDRDTAIDNARHISCAVWQRARQTLVGTVGDRLCLFRHVFHGAADSRDFEVEALGLTEIDRDGRVAALVLFDAADRLEAGVEMLERYARGEGAGILPRAAIDALRALLSRDPAAMRAALDPSVALGDHRRPRPGRAAPRVDELDPAAALLALVDCGATEILWQAAAAEYGSLWVIRVLDAPRAGGSPESLAWLIVHDGDRVVATELWETADLDRARARLDEIGRARAARDADPLRIPPNAATRAGERLRAHALAGDWDGLRALCVPEFAFEDRRALFRMTGDRDTLVANSRHIGREVWRRATRALLATNGDRLALHRNLWRGAEAGSAFEVESLELSEVDAAGRLVAIVVFDADDHRTAAVEMLERYMRGEGARTMPARQVEFLRAMNAHDLAAARAALDADFTFVDHRRTGVGRLAGADEYVASLAALFEQSADLTTDVLYHVAVAEHGSMSVGRMFGTLRSGGGPFESVFVRINRYEDGHCRGVELFELDDLAAASERFAGLGREHATLACGSVRIPANAAIRAFERWKACIAARDWEALREMFTPDMLWEDRRPLLAMTGDRDQLVEIARLAVAVRLAPAEGSVLAAPGNRLLLAWNLFRQGEGEGGPDIDMLQLFEVDEQGRFVSVVWFDGADHRSASLLLHQRLAATSENPLIRRVAAFACAVCERDLAGLRALLPDDLVYDDHRGAGPGRLDGARAYAWAESLLERCQDVCIHQVFHLAATDRALLWVGRASGTPSGGGPREAPFAAVVAADRVEVFALEDIAAAQARFDELSAAESGSSG